MEEKMLRKQLRRQFSPLGWALVVYYVLMNVAVMLVSLVDVLIRMVFQEGFSMADIESVMAGNGWGYLLTGVVGFLILLGWKGMGFVKGQIFKRGKPMTAGAFWKLLCLFMSGQLLLQIVAIGMEVLLNMFGLSLMEAMEMASANSDTFSMFLYAGIAAPITEELLFRGLILRGLRPHGDKFAIVMSALLFGVFHGNPVQIPFAFVVGLVLGYVALEYNVCWAMLLHMLNNLVMGDMFLRLTSGMGEILSTMLFWLILILFGVAAVVILILDREEIGEYLRREKTAPQCTRAFFTAAGILAIFILSVGNMLMFLTLF